MPEAFYGYWKKSADCFSCISRFSSSVTTKLAFADIGIYLIQSLISTRSPSPIEKLAKVKTIINFSLNTSIVIGSIASLGVAFYHVRGIYLMNELLFRTAAITFHVLKILEIKSIFANERIAFWAKTYCVTLLFYSFQNLYEQWDSTPKEDSMGKVQKHEGEANDSTLTIQLVNLQQDPVEKNRNLVERTVQIVILTCIRLKIFPLNVKIIIILQISSFILIYKFVPILTEFFQNKSRKNNVIEDRNVNGENKLEQ